MTGGVVVVVVEGETDVVVVIDVMIAGGTKFHYPYSLKIRIRSPC